MNIKEINIELRRQARQLGLCNKWFNEWDLNSGYQELIDKYKKGIDFAMEHNFPSNEFIVENIDKEILDKNNIYVNTEFYEYNPKSDCVVLDSEGKLIFGGFAVRDIYINGESDVEIEAADNSKIFVSIYGNPSVHIIQRGLAEVYTYNYGDGQITFSGNVNVKKKY